MGRFANAIAAEAQRGGEGYLYVTTIYALSVQGLVYLCVGASVSWPGAGLALAAGVGIAIMLRGLVGMSQRGGADETVLARSLLRRLTDVLQGVKPLKAMHQEELVARVLESETRELNRELQRQVLGRTMLRSMQEALMLALLGIAVYAGALFLALPLAQMTLIALLGQRIITVLNRIQTAYQGMAARESAYWSMREAIESAVGERETMGGARAPRLRDGIHVDGVSFRYQEKPVLVRASLTITAGSLTVLVGPSGAGKTTVADLVTGLERPQEGEVFIDGVPLRDIDLRRWRRMIGYVPQEQFLLHDTVWMNVTLGDSDLAISDVHAALEAAGAAGFVAQLPAGVDTIVGERGLRLSGGQRQRIALARALVRRPALLVLDEATGALDPETEREVCETLRSLRERVTMLAICHHGALPRLADRVYRVEEGAIQEADRWPAAAGADGVR
jgi:ATP-binding cassette subfamily C protein